MQMWGYAMHIMPIAYPTHCIPNLLQCILWNCIHHHMHLHHRISDHQIELFNVPSTSTIIALVAWPDQDFFVQETKSSTWTWTYYLSSYLNLFSIYFKKEMKNSKMKKILFLERPSNRKCKNHFNWTQLYRWTSVNLLLPSLSIMNALFLQSWIDTYTRFDT